MSEQVKKTNRKIAVLGANGIVGTTLIAKIQNLYPSYETIAISRSYENKTQAKTTYRSIDLNNTNELTNSLKEVEIAFLTAGIEYSASVWQAQWPALMNSVIKACLQTKTKLVFFDNVYSYGKFYSEITENLAMNPVSIKGRVRKVLDDALEHARDEGLEYITAKSGEFYGPGVYNSSIYNACLENIINDKAGFWLGSLEVKRTYTYVPDAVRAMLILAFDETNYNQAWHLPTSDALTGSEYKVLFEKILNKQIKISAFPKYMARLIGLFNPTLRELLEMYYQFENDYIFNSDKFMSKYPEFKITSYEEGLRKTIESYQN
jgi:nucleoside-diphosphate-sugar epimerase